MNKLNFVKIIMTLIIITTGIFAGIHFTKDSDKNKSEPKPEQEDVLLFTVSDVSKNCFSNGLKVYSNNKYEIHKGAVMEGEDSLIKTGTYNYDIDKLMASFNNDTCDMETYMNYRVTISPEESYCISIGSNTELNTFLNSLNEENLFWCN